MSLTSLVTLYVCVTSVFSLAKLIDLSHKHGPDTFMAPGMAPYERQMVFKGEFAPGLYYEMANLRNGEHGGTHMDAPSHFIEGAKSIDKIPLANLVLDGVMIDCSKDVNGDENYVMPLQKILDWESENGVIPDGAGVVINFGWSSRFSNPSEYVQSKNLTSFSFFQFPTLCHKAAKYLMNNRKVKMVAVDTAGPDLNDFPIHRIVLGADATLVENVRDPGRLPARGFRLHAAPVAFVEASGTQVRFFAITEDDDYFSRRNGGESFLVESILNIAVSLVCISMAAISNNLFNLYE